MREFLQYFFTGTTNGAIYAVIALGYSTLFASTKLINFAHGEFVMLGAMIMVTFLGIGSTVHLPWPLALVAAAFAGALLGVLFERGAIRTARKDDPIVLVIITVGASIMFRSLAMLVWGKDPATVPAFTEAEPLEIAGAFLNVQSLWIVGIVALLVFWLHLFYVKTLTGKAMKAASINKKAASLLGIPTRKMVLLSFALSGGLGGLAGAIIAPITMNTCDMGTMLGLKGFSAAMLGGIGGFRGAVAGGFILGIAESLGVGYISSSMKDAFAFLLLLLILYVRPEGLLGEKSVHRF